MRLRMSSALRPLLGLGLWLASVQGSVLVAENAVLKQSEAQLRKKQVDDVRYALDIDLPETDIPFQGKVRMDFSFRPQGEALRVDFDKGEVLNVEVNAQKVKFAYDGMAIRLDESLFKSNAANVLEITYSHAYSKDGAGLYWFKDPVDQKAYTFTQFEPYDANRLFPCFDQPDLKATYQLTVKAPKTWTVVSAAREQSITESGDKNVWQFPATQKFSTYLISMHAGPYRIWEDKSYRIPLRIMARQSLAQYMPVDQWFKATRHGFDFYDKYLGYAYPFGKYDQVVVPDFNAGAMENVASVTFSERFLARGQRTQADEQGLAGTILHEMAHMWFGDLVTMQWWNDLWLNESFATYASSLAMAADPRFPNTWLGYYRSKGSAYYADQLVTTHPIVAEVPDTETASSNFDGITYGKGGAFLKQLHFLVGDVAFQKALQSYFQKHAFSNTQVGDFIGAMETATGRSLQSFAQDWLQTAGVNSLTTEFSCRKNRLQSLTLVQGASPEQATLREHKTSVALYQLKQGKLVLIRQAAVGYQGPRTAWKEAKGLQCPDLVFPNAGDHDYAKVKLDAKSFKTATSVLHQIKDPMERMMVWSAVTDMMNDSEISLKDYTKFVVQQMPKEKNYEVLRSIDGRVGRELLGYVEWVPEPASKREILEQLLQVYADGLKAPQLEADSKKVLLGTYLQMLTQSENKDALLAILQGRTQWPNVTIDQDERWSLIEALSKLGHTDALKMADAEAKVDPTSQGRRRLIGIQAAFPDYAQKMKMLEPIVKASEKIPGAERWAVMGNLFPSNQRLMKKQYEPTYRQEIDGLVKKLEPGVARSYVMSLLPTSCDNSTLPLIDELIARGYPKSIHDSLRVAKQSNERCQKVMARLLVKAQG